MTAQIYAFPTARRADLVDQLTLGFVERLDQPGAGVPFLRAQFEVLAESKLAGNVPEKEARSELFDLLHTIAIEVHRLFDLDVSGLVIEVPTLGATIEYDRLPRAG